MDFCLSAQYCVARLNNSLTLLLCCCAAMSAVTEESDLADDGHFCWVRPSSSRNQAWSLIILCVCLFLYAYLLKHVTALQFACYTNK